MHIKHVSLGVSALVGALLLVLCFWFLSPDSSYRQADLTFDFRGVTVSGKLVLPAVEHNEPLDCMVFVHGDGAMPYDGYGYFAPYFSQFARQEMCSFSWNKPGVDGAPGNWHDYSMSDRAALVEAAIAALRANSIQSIGRVGLIGFSQAGWVLPKVEPVQHDIAFYIFVSPAINWVRQSEYMTDLRQGVEAVDAAASAANLAVDELLMTGMPYEAFRELAEREPTIDTEMFSASRWSFVVKNMHADLTADLKALDQVPVLLFTGARDGQVDAIDTATVFAEVLGESLESRQFATAGHSMTEVERRYPMQGMDGIWLLANVVLQGSDAFVEGYWAAMKEFIAATKQID